MKREDVKNVKMLQEQIRKLVRRRRIYSVPGLMKDWWDFLSMKDTTEFSPNKQKGLKHDEETTDILM